MSYLLVFQIAAVMVVLVTLISLRRAHIRVEYSVSWLSVGCLLLAAALSHRFVAFAATLLGLNPEVCLLILAGALAWALVFEISVAVSKLRDENVMLIQRVAILEYHVRELQADRKAPE